MPDQRGVDPDGVERFITMYTAAGVEAGMPAMPARVFAALMISETGRMTAAELAATLKASPAAVSGAVRYLIQAHLIHREREVGSRRDTFVMPEGFWYEAIVSRSNIISRWSEAFKVGLDSVDSDSAAGERLAETLDFFEFIEEKLPAMLEEWRTYRKSKHKEA